MDADALLAALAPERASFLRLARRRMVSDADAEDVVQRALVRAATHAGTLADPARVRAWFYRILRHTIVDFHRSRGPERIPLEADEWPAAGPSGGSVCGCAAHLMAELRPAYRAVLQRVDLDGADPVAVAAELGISIGNLHVRLHRARQALRAKVAGHCGVDSLAPCLDCTCDARRCCGGERYRPRAARNHDSGDIPMASNETIARAFVEAFYRGDVIAARSHLADDLSFAGPAAKLRGAEAFLRMAGHVAPGVKALQIHKVFVDGDDVCLVYDLLLDHRVERLTIAEWQRFRGDKIAEIRLLFDTAPFRERSQVPDAELATDPVCSMRVAKSEAAATRVHAGATHYFCARACAAAFDADPAKYLPSDAT